MNKQIFIRLPSQDNDVPCNLCCKIYKYKLIFANITTIRLCDKHYFELENAINTGREQECSSCKDCAYHPADPCDRIFKPKE